MTASLLVYEKANLVLHLFLHMGKNGCKCEKFRNKCIFASSRLVFSIQKEKTIVMIKKGRIPHTYVIVFFIVVLAGILTWFIPGGNFEREKVNVNGVEREVIVNDSFKYTESNPQTCKSFLPCLMVL
jgi:hypothetical protein